MTHGTYLTFKWFEPLSVVTSTLVHMDNLGTGQSFQEMECHKDGIGIW